MAVAQVGQWTGNANGNGVSVTVSGVTSGNLLVILVGTEGNQTPITYPTGFTEAVSATQGGAPSGRASAAIAWKVADGTEGNLTVGYAVSENIEMDVREYSGVDDDYGGGGTPIAATNSGTSSTAALSWAAMNSLTDVGAACRCAARTNGSETYSSFGADTTETLEFLGNSRGVTFVTTERLVSAATNIPSTATAQTGTGNYAWAEIALYEATVSAVNLTCTAAGSASVSATLDVDVEMSATAAGTSSVASTMHAEVSLSATAAGSSTASGSLTAQTSLSATAAGSSSVAVSTSVEQTLNATISATSSATGTLTVEGGTNRNMFGRTVAGSIV